MTDVDILIIGGGINGVGVAQAAAAAGHSVLLTEQNTIASATSRNSTKLIHGGLRYLESMQMMLVYEALHEREILLKLAPGLVSREWFYIPVYRHSKRPAWMVKTGLGLYWLLSSGRSRFKSIPQKQWKNMIPGLNTEHMTALLAYEDAATDDALLTGAVARSAEQLGATILEHTAFVSAIFQDDRWLVQLRPDTEIRATILINATGPWINTTRQYITPPPPVQEARLVQGTHLLLDRPCSAFVYVESGDGRVMFFRPWKNGTLAGTTETEFHGDPAMVHATQQEVTAILATYNHYFPDQPCSESDILEYYCGIRVLPQYADSAFSASRSAMLVCDNDDKPSYLAIYGGKLTTYRKEAEKVERLISRRLPARQKADTGKIGLE